MQNRYETRLIAQESTAFQTASFYFEKPIGFEFEAGQFIELTLRPPGLPEPDRTHSFSICSAPHEDYLAITTRLRESPFKEALRHLTPDDSVEIEGPYGKFVIPSDASTPIAILAGGVGITPALSIIKDAARNSWRQGFYLFYSNRSEAETPFLAELTRIEAENREFRLIATMTADQSWQGEKERISIEMIRRYIDPARASFYASGPPNMVTAMREMLTKGGVPKEKVWFESFSGY